MKYLLALFIITCAVSAASAVPFVPGAGGKPSKEDRKDYASRAGNYSYKKKAFFNLEDVPVMEKTEDFDSKRLSAKKTAPVENLPYKMPEFKEKPAEDYFSFTWFGHSSLLIQMHGMNILFDPVFSKRISPVQWIGPGKFFEPPVTIEQLPEIDIVIISHDHYDHLDYEAIKKLDKKTKKFVVPLGVECHLKKWKIAPEKIINMAWWESTVINGLSISAAPAQHFSGRWVTGRNGTLWNSWVLKDQYRQIFESGDSGYGSHFKKINEWFGSFDMAFMECGQYNARWPKIHSFPEETAEASVELGAKLVMPMHWGAMVLSTNGWDDSVLRFIKAAEEKNIEYVTPYLCQTVDISKPELYREKWWESVK